MSDLSVPLSDKARRQRELDELAFRVLAARHTGPESWMRWSDWFELTKARLGDCGLGNTTFSECTKRLVDQGKVRRCLFVKNRFYQAIFTPGSSSGAMDGHDSVAPTSDRAALALEHLLSRKPSGVV